MDSSNSVTGSAGLFASGTTKRSVSEPDDTSNKKMKIDLCNSSTSSVWNLGNQLNTMKSKDCVDSTALQMFKDEDVDNAKLVTLNSAAPANQEDLLMISNCGTSDLNDMVPSSPLQSGDLNEEYVLFSSDVMGLVNDDDYDVMTNSKVESRIPSSPSVETSLSSASTSFKNPNPNNKELSLKKNPSKKAIELIDVTASETHPSDEIELVLLSSIDEQKPPSSVASADKTTSDNVPHLGKTTTTTGTFVMDSNFGLGSESVTVATSTAAVSSNALIKNAATNVKSQPILVNTKKLMSEVTQTTAKVSIGNTTISVPLLKPLSSTQLVQTCNIMGESQMTSQSSAMQTVPNQQPQINLSKILNVKRGTKLSQPTFVSLSQLQIKPVTTTTAKIVQAKVFGKKVTMPFPQTVSSTSITTPTTGGIVTITAAKQKHNLISNLYSKVSQITVQRQEPPEDKTLNDSQSGGDHSDASKPVSPSVSNEPVQKVLICKTQSIDKKSIGETSHSAPTAIVQAKIADTEERATATTNSTPTAKQAHPSVSSASGPPLLKPLSKQPDQQGNVSHYAKSGILSSVSMAKQSNPQVITSSVISNYCTSIGDNDYKISIEPATAKPTVTLSSNVNKQNTLVIPKSISLMLTKSSSSQNLRPSHTVVSNLSAADVLTKKALPPNTQNAGNANEKASGPGSAGASPKAALISVSMPSESVTTASVTEKSSQPRKSSKQQTTVKAAKSSGEGTIEISIHPTPEENSKSTNLDAMPAISQTNACNEDKRIDVGSSDQNQVKTTAATSKPQETHNVLLKQLLQTSSVTHNTNQIISLVSSKSQTGSTPVCSQVLSARKVINVRAPSLGLVSSLEAQLARPVIPPVPAVSSSTASSNTTTSTAVSSSSSSLASSSTVASAMTQAANTPKTDDSENAGKCSEASSVNSNQIETKAKTPNQIISKETSFVSNPQLKANSPEITPQFGPPSFASGVGKSSVKVSSGENSTTHKDADGHRTEKAQAAAELNKKTQEENNSTQISKILTPSSSSGPAFPATSDANNVRMTVSISHVQQSSAQGNVGITSAATAAASTATAAPTDSREKSKEDNTSAEAKKFPPAENVTNQQIATTDSKSIVNQLPMVNANAAKTPIVKTFAEDTIAENVPAKLPQTIADKTNDNLAKEVEMRKKRKREYQKQRRQAPNANKVTVVNPVPSTSNLCQAKKRPRKLPKIDEDYDGFIDNLMAHVRQMPPLQILEPMLHKHYGIGGIYGSKNYVRSLSCKESEDQLFKRILSGEYGNGHSPGVTSVYDSKTKHGPDESDNKRLFSIHNNFYDQEFSPIMCKNEYEVFSRLISSMRERNVEALEIVSGATTMTPYSLKEKNAAFIEFPGLILLNDSYDPLYGRMSPIIPYVTPMKMNRLAKTIITAPTTTTTTATTIKKEATSSTMAKQYNNKILSNGPETMNKVEKEIFGQTVILSLPTTAADNVLGVLKDLANLLHIAPPSTYKIYPHRHSLAQHNGIRRKELYSKKQNHHGMALQSILNGRNRLCRNCGQGIKKSGIRALKSEFSSIKSVLKTPHVSPPHFYFCGRTCYKGYKQRDEEYNANAAMTKTKAEEEGEIGSVKIETDALANQKDVATTKTSTYPRYKTFKKDCFPPAIKVKHNTEKDIRDMLFKMNITVSPNSGYMRNIDDSRKCVFCKYPGDGVSDGPSRLLNFDVDKWVHLNCALWSNGVYETVSGGLMNFPAALQISENQTCILCQNLGATVKCFKNRCSSVYHLPCAIRDNCVFYKNKTIHCQQHALRTEREHELLTLSVHRRVFVERDENRQVASVMLHSELSNLLRIGSLTFLNVGQLLPHQLEAFHTVHHIYPIGYKIMRYYWSVKKPNKRVKYICSIAEVHGRPEFRVQMQDPVEGDMEFRDSSPKLVWQQILEPLMIMRRENDLVQLFPQFISGEDLFGLTEPAIVRIIESLPGIETLTDYRFKYGRNPLLELPLAINPSGAARTEPKQRQVLSWRKPHTQRTGSASNHRIANQTNAVVAGEVACPYSKQFVHSKSSQYKKMKQEWRNNVYLARSKIQGLGLYSARDIEKHTMIIEYIGEVIRTEVSELREKQYEARNRGIYMFRLDEDRVVDATLSGGLARYINHSCAPNCVTEIVEVDREVRIIIFAKRRINRGEELSYDYKFDIEDDAHKIPCMCGAVNCRKWMN